MIGDGPAHHPAAPGVEDDGQVDLALSGRVFGHVYHPETVRLGRVEVPTQQILGEGGIWVTPSAAPELPPVDTYDAGLAQSLDPLAGAADASPSTSSAWTRGEP